ncbi:MAG: DRTGG domain-containing protein [Anaerolineaceae bacterium]|nr:DRTGG domain-containing protein [Anaerolineaceae bacterium]
MNLQEVIDSLQLKILTEKKDFSTIKVSTGYTSDLLSCVMTGAEDQCIWITLMAHSNIIAVASLLDVAAIIITENAQPDETTIARANQQSIILLSTPIPTFNVVGQLWDLGIRGT